MIPTMSRRANLVFVTSVLTAIALSAPAAARTERKTTHSVKKVWPTAVRHLRVDEGFSIVEKDAEVGYVVFEMSENGKVFSGALEVVVTTESGKRYVKLILSIEDRPSYMEGQVLDRLLAKLRKEHGDAPDPRPIKKPKAEEKPDDDNKGEGDKSS